MNLRKFLALAAMLLLPFSAALAADYSVFKTEGEVRLLHKGDSLWRAAQKREPLALQDRVRIGEASSIAIVDGQSGRIYRCAVAGEKRVHELIASAKESAARVSALACKELAAELKANPSQSNNQRVGAAYRGENDLKQLDQLAKHLPKDKKIALTVIRQDGMVHFALKNRTGKSLYVNVLKTAADGTRSICFDFQPAALCEGLLLPPRKEMGLPQYEFIDDGAAYSAFSSNFPYDTRALQLRLR